MSLQAGPRASVLPACLPAVAVVGYGDERAQEETACQWCQTLMSPLRWGNEEGEQRANE